MRVVFGADAAKIVGITPFTLKDWLRRGAAKSANNVAGPGGRRAFDARGLLRLALFRALRQRGFKIAMATTACDGFDALSDRAREDAWSDGRILLLALGPHTFPRLLRPDELPTAEIAAASQAGLAVATVDVAKMHREIVAQLAQLDTQSDGEAGRET